jgi:hypothetical protein
MKTRFCPGLAVIVAAACLIPAPTRAYTTNVHTSFHWHMHQPVYWPNRRDYGVDHYEQAWDTIQQQDAGRPDPSPEVLSAIFGEADRVNAYQTSPYDALSSILSYPNSGAQMSFSGALIENVQSLAAAGQLGYGTDWNHDNQILRGWTTSGGHPRLDLVNFTCHHALAPLVSAATLQMELLIQQRQMQIFWGTNPPQSRGYFPAETCFAEYMIPTLQSNGIQWSIVANNHLARACADFPVVTGSGGENCDLPNQADQLDPAQGAANYQRISISVGCGPAQVMPFGFQVHYARYVDPQTGAASTLMVVPSDQAFSWMDSYGTWNLDLLAPLQARNNPAKPALALFAHDGDNDWSGGYTYYNQWVSQLAGQAASLGYEPTTIEQFLQDFPPGTNDIVHVESGGWVFAAGDFGSPIFINWHWPPSYTAANGAIVVDPSQGISDKADNWRVITATENRVKTAQQISGITPDVDQIRDPGSFSGTPNAVELGWHYYLASLDSGFVYYGCIGDECERSTVAQSNAVRNVDPILSANPGADTTPPTIFIPQRHPWNPGGTNFGVQYGYTLAVETNTDFWIWTYAYDVSGITNATLFFRINGINPPVSDEFKTYAGGPGTGHWIASNLTLRVVPPTLGVTPQYIADYYYAKVTGVTNAYVDYYVSATDRLGNTSQSPIQHVWVGAGSGGSGGGNGNGCDGAVCITPAAPVAGSQVTIQYDPAGGPIASATNVDIHLGWNGWNPVVSPDAPMTYLAASHFWLYTVTIPNAATQLNCCFNNGSGTWDNNSGANWNFFCTNTLAVTVPAFLLDGAFDYPGYLLASNSTMVLYAALRGTVLYVATGSPGTNGPNDCFIFVTDHLLASATNPAPWAKAGMVAVASNKPYLAAESQNTYLSWYLNDTQTNYPCAKSATTNGALAGTIDLMLAFGYIPANIYLCAAAYVTTNGGALVAQCPAGSGPNINPGGFLEIPTIALNDSNGSGVFDLLDPTRGFVLLGASLTNGVGFTLDWASMPGHGYQVVYRNTLSNPWTDLPGASNVAGPLQLILSYTDPVPTNAVERFYGVKLAP